MDQLVKEQTQKLLANQMRDARLQRQKQVRQQAMAWTEATRRKFEQTKEREIKGLANTVTGQVQNAAMLNIEQLTRQNDLAMAEIGMAHRAAAGFQNVERMKSLKRLRNEEMASNRGSAAMIRHLKQKETEKSKSMALLKRKEEVRKVEDRLSKDLISRRPLTVSNSDTKSIKSKAKLGPPEYQQSIAKTLKTVSTEGIKQSKESSKPSTSSSAKAEKNVRMPRKSSSSDLILKGNKKRPSVSKEGLLDKMVRIKASSPSKAGLDFNSEDAWENFSTVKDLYGVGYKLRSKYMEAARGTALRIPTPVQSNVRYFDSTIPKGEVKYVAPSGLAVKETSNSPDAWEKGRQFSEELLQQQKNKTLKEEEITQKAAERGKLALKKAKLEKEILQVRNELLEDIDFQLLGTGSQKAILGLEEESENKVDETDMVKPLHHESPSSDEFSAVDSDEEYIFPDPHPSTLKKFDLLHNKSEEKSSSPSDSNKSSSLVSSKIIPKQSLNDSTLDNNSLLTTPSNPSSDESSALKNLKTLKKLDSTPPRSDKSSGTDVAPPLGLAVKGTSSDPDAPVKGTQFSEEPLQQQSNKTLKEDKIAQTAAERMKLALLKKASELKKEISQDRNKILEEEIARKAAKKMKLALKKAKLKKETPQDQNKILEDDFQPSSAGSEKAILGVEEESENKVDKTDMVKPAHESMSSDEFSAVDSDDEYTFPDSHPSSKIGVIHDKSEDKSSGPSDSDKSSALISIKIKAKPLSTDSTLDSSSLLAAPSNPSSDESSALVNLKILEKSNSTPSRSDKSSGSTTDYYSPPDGPFTSNNLIQRALKSAEIPCIREPPGCSRPDGKKPDGLTLVPWEKGKSLLWDYTCRDTFARSYVHKTSHEPGYAAKKAEDDKYFHYKDLMDQFIFVPVASETSGIFGSKGLALLKKIGSKISNVTQEKRSTSYLFQRIAVAIQRGNVASIMGTIPPTKNLGNQSRSSSEDGNLDNLKRRTLHHYLSKFLERRPDSIEKLPVTTSLSSVIRADSDVLETESFQSIADVTDGIKQNNTHLSRHSNKYSSDSASSSKRALSTLYEDLNRTDSGSTIAETAIVAGRIVSSSSINTTTATTDSSEIKDETPPTLHNSSSTDAGLISSDSLTGLIRVLSSQQEIERQQLARDGSSNGEELNQSGASSSSRDSIPDASAILKRLMKKQSARNSSRSSGSNSSRSGPERETKRTELLDDVSPVKLLETSPRTNKSGANDTQKLSAVFETLIDKWSNMRIEKPPWTANSDHDQKEEEES